MNRLKDKVALITGGTSGIGAETARLFIQEGAKVVISGRSKEKGSKLAEELGDNALYCLSDITKEEDIEKAISFVTESMGKLDILFNNAGGPVGAGLEKVTQKDIDYGVHLLLASVILGTKYAIEPMRRNGGGCIINNSSIAGIRHRQGDPLYAALKAGVTHYTKMSGVELGKDNIRVNAILPGLVDGDRIRRVIEAKSQQRGLSFADVEAEALSFSSIKDYTSPKHLADQILLLASTRGRMISGQALSIDGDTKMLV